MTESTQECIYRREAVNGVYVAVRGPYFGSYSVNVERNDLDSDEWFEAREIELNAYETEHEAREEAVQLGHGLWLLLTHGSPAHHEDLVTRMNEELADRKER